MNNEQLKDILIAKIEQEFNIYKQNLIKNCTKEEIIDKSYEINFKEETLSILEGATLSFKEIKALLSTEKILEKMYDKYMNIETSNLDNMRDIVQEIVEDIDKEFTKKCVKTMTK